MTFNTRVKKYYNYVSKSKINNVAKKVRDGRVSEQDGLKQIYNAANVKYRTDYKSWMYSNVPKAFGLNYVTKPEFKRKIDSIIATMPTQPPCVGQGRTNRSKNREATIRMTGRAARRVAGSVLGAGGTAARTVGLAGSVLAKAGGNVVRAVGTRRRITTTKSGRTSRAPKRLGLNNNNGINRG
jgi:hypothetical protein